MTTQGMDGGDPVELGAIREQIDALDRQIVALIARRGVWVRRAGALKSDPSQAAAPDRAARVVDAAVAVAIEVGADAEVVRATYLAMVAAFVRLEADTIAVRSENAEAAHHRGS